MTATMSMQQGGANAAAQDLEAQIRQDLETEVANLRAAAQDAAAAGQSEPVVRIGGDDGVIVIRDQKSGEEVVIQRDAIPPWIQNGPPEGVFMIPIALFASIAFVIVGLPIARAFARRMDSKNAARVAAPASTELRQIQTSIDTMAVELERMSEHQRFLTRVLSERTPEPLSAAHGAERAARS